MTTKEKDEMIALFMEEKLSTFNGILSSQKIDGEIAHYSTSWDKLMPVIGKITGIAVRGPGIPENIYEPFVIEVQDGFLGNDLPKVYDSCIPVINWYNSEKTKAGSVPKSVGENPSTCPSCGFAFNK